MLDDIWVKQAMLDYSKAKKHDSEHFWFIHLSCSSELKVIFMDSTIRVFYAY
jgi:hypothetical protein